MSRTSLEEADAQLYVLLCNGILLFPERLESFFAKIRHCASNSLSFTNPLNLLNVLLVYTSPVVVPITVIETVSRELFSAYLDPVDTKPDDLLLDIQDLAQWLEIELQSANSDINSANAYIKAAQVFASDAQSQVALLGFGGQYTGYEPLSFAFACAKTLQLATYLPNLGACAPLYSSLSGYAPFDSWYNGIVLPYQYFWRNHASLQSGSLLPEEFLALESHFDQFDFLVSPLEDQKAPAASSPSLYFENVILPLAAYHGNDMNPLTLWLKKKKSHCNLSKVFYFWDQLLRTVLSFRSYKGDEIPLECCSLLLKYYVACGLYYGIYVEALLSSVEKLRVQEQIRATSSFLCNLCLLEDLGSISLGLKQLPESIDYAQFLLLPSISAILDPLPQHSLLFLNQIVSTCCALFPINGFTMRRYLELKQKEDITLDRTKREIFSIFLHVTENNYHDLFNALNLFCDEFFANNPDNRSDIDQVVFERLMESQKIHIAMEYLNNSKVPININVCFDITLGKLWNNYNAVSSLEEVLAPQLPTQQCLNAIEALIPNAGFGEARGTIVKLKHYFRALSLLKNFRFYFAKGKPVTPKDILDKLNQVNADDTFTPMSLVSVILEQNRKAYLVYEKLYKISVDLAIFLDFADTWSSFSKVRCACIESSLIERDFNFAYKHSKELITFAVDEDKTDTLSGFWLIFYQVGKFVPHEWLDEYEPTVQRQKIDVLMKQREILSLALKYLRPTQVFGDNSRLLIGQFSSVNDEIHRWYKEENTHQNNGVSDAMQTAQTTLRSNLDGLMKEAAESKNQAGEKISNLLVSGLGWAIGASNK